MKYLFYLVIAILTLSFVGKADTWRLPTTEKYCSENKRFCLRVEPKNLTSQLAYFEDKVDGKDNAGADKKEKDNYCKGTFFSKGKKLWNIQLDNEVSPVSALISNNGEYVITFDNWHGVGYGDNVVTIYNGLTGKLIKKLGLTNFLTESDIYELPASVSSIHWHGTHQIDYEKKQLILKVVKPSKGNDQFFDVHIDLATGAILDEVVDRLPSLQFFFSLGDGQETEPKFADQQDLNQCAGKGEATQISFADMKDRILHSEMPKYPPAARAVRAIGESVFEIQISVDGKVECVTPLSGHPLLRATLMKAINSWEFKKDPMKYRGKLVISGSYALILNGKVVED